MVKNSDEFEKQLYSYALRRVAGELRSLTFQCSVRPSSGQCLNYNDNCLENKRENYHSYFVCAMLCTTILHDDVHTHTHTGTVLILSISLGLFFILPMVIKRQVKGKGKWIYTALFLYYLTLKALRYGSHSFTCNYTNACLYVVSVHQMAPPQTDVADIYWQCEGY